MLLTNQVGYRTHAPKTAVLQGEAASYYTLTDANGELVYKADVPHACKTAQWHTGAAAVLDFTPVTTPGTYKLSVYKNGLPLDFCTVNISNGALPTLRLLNALTMYFKAQRSGGEIDSEDSHLPFDGERKGVCDVHGGWYDATGDNGIHMSHLSHSTRYNPQQVPLCAWMFYHAADTLEARGVEQASMLNRRLIEEGAFGADFIMRMQAPSKNFYRTINRADSLAPVRGTRRIGFEYKNSSSQFSEAETADIETVTDENYETSLRCGGGLCVAALAIAARHTDYYGEYKKEQYLAAAREAWQVLCAKNELYTNDGKANLVDVYCALMAATELYNTTHEDGFLNSARTYCTMLLNSAVPCKAGDVGKVLLYDDGTPFFHAADEGLPVMALLLYSDCETDKKRGEEALALALELLHGTLASTYSDANPFGYAKFWQKNGDELTPQWFFPHDTTAAPWWQGENARIASLAAAARMAAVRTDNAALACELYGFAQNQIDWIFGKNPFDACMLEGYGRNNIQYYFKGRCDFLNSPAGVCNGITSGLDNPNDIAFIAESTPEIDDNWRWAEQWIPHVCWLALALVADAQQ